MNIVVTETHATPDECYVAGQVYCRPDEEALSWCRAGIARPTTNKTPEQRGFDQWYATGAGEPCLYLPWIGEFGWQVMHRMRFVHFHGGTHKIVCIKPGEEVLYPSADGFITEWTDPIPDKLKAGAAQIPEQWPALAKQFKHLKPIETGGLTPLQELTLTIHLDQPIQLKPKRRGLWADVVLGVRHREFCPQKNWPHWNTISRAMKDMGLIVAVVGKRPHTLDLDGQDVHSGDFPDTDAAVELLQNCRLFIGSDTGPAHLASVCGSRMLVFREEHSQQRDFIPRMAATNPGRVTTLPKLWDQPQTVVSMARDILKESQ